MKSGACFAVVKRRNPSPGSEIIQTLVGKMQSLAFLRSKFWLVDDLSWSGEISILARNHGFDMLGSLKKINVNPRLINPG